jgi:hypothetical protein
MNIQIKGKLYKRMEDWCIEISVIDEPLACNSPLNCLKALEKHLKAELQDENLNCFFHIGDGGLFYLVTAQTQKMAEFVATRFVDLNDLKVGTGVDY